MWGATLEAGKKDSWKVISIHAPRVGSDAGLNHNVPGIGISIHAPRVGSDSWILRVWSTDGDFNPRSPCGERPQGLSSGALRGEISIHAPRVGSDLAVQVSSPASLTFQSTLPVWGATQDFLGVVLWKDISIHAPRVGSDLYQSGVVPLPLYFNPRSPCGERRSPCKSPLWANKFQSTLPVWGATGIRRV